MAHRTLSSAYQRLTDRLNRAPQGAPPSELLHGILKMLFSEREADLVSLLPIKPFTAKKAALAWKMGEDEAAGVLDELAHRAILLDYERPDGVRSYVLPPPMAGFFEFSLMRVRDDLDQKALSDLFEQYITREDDFMRELVGQGGTQMGRALVQEPALPEDEALHVLDHERATEVIRTATHIGVAMCYCRHKAMHQGRNCDAPMDICMAFNTPAESLIRHGHIRRIDQAECLDLLQRAYEHNLVQFSENQQKGVSFICNCCGCCCEALTAARRFALMRPINTTNYLPEVDAEACTGCGKCAALCPVEAMSVVSANDPSDRRRKKARVDEAVCLGCGVCVRPCPKSAIALKPRGERVIVPKNTVHRAVLMAVERGKLQHLLFDNQASMTHQAMAAVLGAVLRLPPVKRAAAAKLLNSRYVDALLARAPQ